MGRSQTNPRSLENLRPWPPGTSGNPGGCPRGFVSEIRRATKNGHELVTFALRVLRDEQAEMRDRGWACSFLADRGFGKPTQAVELEGPAMIPAAVLEDARQLFDARMARLQAAVARDGQASVMSHPMEAERAASRDNDGASAGPQADCKSAGLTFDEKFSRYFGDGRPS
jgi:hypothetical protein